MKKIIFRKFLFDCLAFFIISLISTSVIIWVFQAVNYLDIIIDEGRGYDIYLAYSFLSFPKILSKILPFAFFFSFSYVIAKYELNNQLLIFWNFGISKIKFIHFFFIFSIFLFFFQIIFTTLLVPKSQELARSIIRTSNYNFVDNFIKIKKFNADVNDLTIYTESKDQDGNYNNIYIKKNSGKNDFQLTIAKKGVFRNKNDLPILELYDGENSNLINGKITKFSFTKSEFNLSSYSNNTILVKKTQEHKTIEIVKCIKTLTNGNIDKIKKIKKEIRNCDLQNLDNIIAELYKRFVIPLYIPVLMLITMLLITQSKEKVNYSKYRLFIFLFGFLIIIFSESTLRFINTSFYNNFLLSLIPVVITIFLYFYFLIKLNFRKSIK